MNTYYVGLNVHKAIINIAVLNGTGKSVMESVVESSAATVTGFIKGLWGHAEVIFEEGSHAAWLYDVLKKTKAQVIVCDPCKNRLLCDGNGGNTICSLKIRGSVSAGCIGEHTECMSLWQLYAAPDDQRKR